MTFDIIDINLFLAAAQAFLLTLLIFHKHRQLYANRFLGLMLLCYSLILVHLIFWETGFYHAYPYLYPQILGLSLLVGPCHYLYARYLMRYRYRYGFFLSHNHMDDSGLAWSRGIEITIQKKLAREFYGLASISFSRATYRV